MIPSAPGVPMTHSCRQILPLPKALPGSLPRALPGSLPRALLGTLLAATLATPPATAQPTITRTTPAEAGMSAGVLSGGVALYEEAVARGDLVGAVLLVARNGKVVLH